MKRRDFFRGLGLATAGLAILPKIEVNSTPIPEPPVLPDLEELTDSTLTSEFFNYLKNKEVDFNWERITHPMVSIDENTYVLTRIRKLRTSYTCEHIQDLNLYFGTEMVKQRLIFDSIIKEIGMICKKQNNRTIYLYELLFTSTMYHPESSEPWKGFILRSGFDSYRKQI